ncbi:NusG domain II-containing protein [Geomonas propionica]|uniref:NusG domain II-containing protein n=1 Tax=Geomonas propionica TaxID=2798582 RepID=A0ABS0YPE9_9BACT|nr:NusG domain II-containing protein [Geomonas propionica]MBJ6799791.1 NusG domain II-containing protein [Geomonas propionica]
MTRGDKILVAVILLLAIGCAAALYGRFLLLDRPRATRAVVTVRGKTVRVIELPSRGIFVLQGRSGPAKLEVAGMRIRMREAHCPGGICLRQGWIRRAGESIICVPGEIAIHIEGAAMLDAVTR